jgi:hypothetical protein
MSVAERVAHETALEEREREEAEQSRQLIQRREAPALVYKTHEDAAVSPPEPAPTTKWIEAYFIQKQYFKDQFDSLIQATGEALSEKIWEARTELERTDAETKASLDGLQRELSTLREQAASERALSARAAEVYAQERTLVVQEFRSQVETSLAARAQELDLIRRELEVRVELDYQRDALRMQVAEADRADLVALRRDIEQLREQIGVERSVRDLRSEVAEAQAQIPQVPALFTQLQTETWTAQIEANKKIAALEKELRANKEKLSKLRVQQSQTEHKLQHQAPPPVVELKFESDDGQFTMRDMHPDAAAAWRRFATDMVAANNGVMTPSDPSGQVIAMPVRRSSDAA